MWYWIIKVSILSLVLIYLLHYLYSFFKSTLTVPKIKDLVNTPTQKYQHMYEIINDGSKMNNSSNDNYTLIDLLPKNDEQNMKSELKNFLKSQLHN